MKNCAAGRARQRYAQLPLPLSAALRDALKRHQKNAPADELAAPPSKDATDEVCKGAWNE